MYICSTCNRVWENQDAIDNEFICTRKCGGALSDQGSSFHLKNMFISYGRDTYISIAKRLKLDLQSYGYNVWFDEYQLKVGADWEHYIESGINLIASDLLNGKLIYIMTPHSTRKPDGYCLNELAYAIRKNVSIIPVMLVQCEPPLSIARIQYLDIQDCIDNDLNIKEPMYEKYLNRLIEAIEHNKLDFEGTQSRLLKELNPIKFDNDILLYLDGYVGRNWFSDLFDNWLGSADSPKLFWLVGSPGSGKSAISAWLRENKVAVKAFHFCNYKDKEKSNPVKLVTSIAYQLATQSAEYMRNLAKIDIKNILTEYNDAFTLFEKLILDPLSGNIDTHNDKFVILIDALDESDCNSGNDVARFIASRFQLTPKWLKLFITSRDNVEYLTTTLQGTSKIVVNTNDYGALDDIYNYIRQNVKIGENADVTDEFTKSLSLLCDGNFLFAKWLVKDINSGICNIKNVKNYPRGLGGVYSGYLERLYPDISKYRSSDRSAISVILSSIQPITPSLLSKILNWKEMKTKDFLNNIGTLFLLKNESIVPYHKSISDWLVSKDNLLFHVSIKDGNDEICEYGLKEYKARSLANCEYLIKCLPLHLIISDRLEDACIILKDEEFIKLRINSGLGDQIVDDMEEVYKHGYIDLAIDIVESVINTLSMMGDCRTRIRLIKLLSIMHIESGDVDKALFWSQSSLTSLGIISDASKAVSFMIAGDACKARGLFNDSLIYYHDALGIYSTTGDKVSIANAYISAGHAYYGLFDYDESKKMYNNAASIIEDKLSDFNISDKYDLYDKLSLIEACSGYITQALYYRQKMLQIYNNAPSLLKYIQMCRGLSHIFYHTLQFSESLKYIEMAHRAHATAKYKYSDLNEKILRWLCFLLRLNCKYNDAFTCSTQLMEITLKHNNNRNNALSFSERGACLINAGYIDDGIDLLNKSVDIAENTMTERSFRYLAEGFIAKDNLKSADEYLLKSIDISTKSCKTEAYLSYENYVQLLLKQSRFEEYNKAVQSRDSLKIKLVSQQLCGDALAHIRSNLISFGVTI